MAHRRGRRRAAEGNPGGLAAARGWHDAVSTLGDMGSRGAIHHLELWVRDIDAADATLGWLLHALGYRLADTWAAGRSWRLGDAYIVLESGPDVFPEAHERRRPGLNHLAFHAGSERDVDELTAEAVGHGWTLLFAERHPDASIMKFGKRRAGPARRVASRTS